MQKLGNFNLFLLYSIFIYFNVYTAVSGATPASVNPFTPKAYAVRYWTNHITNNLPKPSFLFDKASQLTAAESASFTKLAAQNSLSTQLPTLCSSAKLFCFPDLTASLEEHNGTVNFATYMDKNFTNYGTRVVGGEDTFVSYSDDENIPVDLFKHYSSNSFGHGHNFKSYATQTNVADQKFSSYGAKASGGVGEFENYQRGVNKGGLGFTSYSAGKTNGPDESFKAYADSSNGGVMEFKSYAKDSNGANTYFTRYGNDSNVITSKFTNYGQNGNGQGNTFTSYSNNTNNPQNIFTNYGTDGNGFTETFTHYRDGANVGDDSFQTYSKNGNGEDIDFVNYGNSVNNGTDEFRSYGSDGSNGQEIGFKIYGVDNKFKEYAKDGISFSKYANESSSSSSRLSTTMSLSEQRVKNRWVEPGKFFREEMLKTGNVMPMPDIRDKMPKRLFLPRAISSILPFSMSRISEMKKIFHADEDSAMAGILVETLTECERAPAKDETKRCVGSMEDMIDFATSVLGGNAVVRTTHNTEGSNKNVMIGTVKGINGGRVTKTVSCHQSLFPYLVYYCHSVPKVRVYEADILDPESRAKINHGVAICHVDTSAWGATHGAFLALGSGPGKIEVCHWIFESDMNWAIAD